MTFCVVGICGIVDADEEVVEMTEVVPSVEVFRFVKFSKIKSVF